MEDEGGVWLLGIAVLATTTLVAGRFLVSPLLPEVIASFDITASSAGIALTVMWSLQAVFQFPGGRLVDAWTPKTVLIGAFAVALVGLAVVLSAGSFAWFVLGLAVFGLGNGLYSPAIVTTLSMSFKSRRARALSFHEIAINVGGISAGALAVAALAIGSWRLGFVPLVVVLVLTAWVTHRRYEQPYQFGPVTLDLAGTRDRMLGDRRSLAMLVAFALLAFSWQGVASFLPTLLQVDKGFGPSLASQAFTGLFVAGIVATLLVAPHGDRLGPVRLATGALLVGAVGIALLVGLSSVIGVLAGILLFGLGGTAFWPLMISALVARLPDENVGGDFGAFSTVYTTLGSLGSAYVGVVADLSSFETAFAGIGGCVLTAALVLAWLSRR